MTPKTLKYGICLCAYMLVMSSCSSNEDSNPSFTIALNPDTYQTQLYTSGRSEPLSISSTNEMATQITIDGTPDYLFYDPESNTINWNKGLPLGETVATIRALNGEEEATTLFRIENSFEGVFQGGINGTDSDDPVNNHTNFNFDRNGTFSMNWHEIPYMGVYYVVGSHVVISLDFTETTSKIFDGQLVYSNTKTPKISGDWYDNTIEPENRLGYFEIVLQD